MAQQSIHPGTPSPTIAYQPLSRDEIRLIRLKPSSYRHSDIPPPDDKDIVVCGIEVHLHSKAPQYTALSYAWGKGNSLKPLFVIDNGLLDISANVVDALYHLRLENEDLFVWIDQLCINQTDNVEKSHQVQQMRRIYSDAVRANAWLGEPADNSDLLLAHIRSMATLSAAKDYAAVIKMHADASFLQKTSQAFRAFCQRSYWKRLWVIQEFSVAKEVIIMCGQASVAYLELRELFAFLLNMPLPWPEVEGFDSTAVLKVALDITRAYKSPATSFLEGIFTRRRRYQLRHGVTAIPPETLSARDKTVLQEKDTLFQVVVTSLVVEIDHNQPEATDPRDRIFSVMHFADDWDEFPSFPDYTRSCEDVYNEVAQRILMQRNIDLLTFCQPPPPEHSLDSPPTASWAPDWRVMIKKPCVLPPWFSKFNASGDTHAQQVVTASDPKTIALRGVVVDTVKETGSTWDPDWLVPLDCHATLAYLAEVESLCDRSPRIPTESDKDAKIAAIRIAIADRYNYTSHETQPELLDGYNEAIKCMETAIKEEYFRNPFGLHLTDTLGLHQPWYMFCLQHLHSRRPFISNSGYVGLAPMHAKQGDQIVIFLGSKAAYIVREVEEDVFELVGEAYVHGVMYGELMSHQPPARTFLLR